MFAVLQYLYLLRFPLISALVLAAFGPVAAGPGKALLSGMFDLDWFGIALASFTTVFLGTACYFSTSLILRYGKDRFRVPVVRREAAMRRWFIALYALAGLIFLFYLVKDARPRTSLVVGVVSATVGVGAAAALLKAIRRVGTRASVDRSRPMSALSRFIASWLAFTPQGYMDSPDAGLLPEHGRALAASVVAHVVYLGLGISKGFVLVLPALFAPVVARTLPAIPTLVCVLLLVMLICWDGAALAFFLDAFRVPAFTVFLALLIVAAQWPQSDHYFTVTEHAGSPEGDKVLPKNVLASGAGPSVIVVAVSGGGIQAAAWSARVLTGLQEASNGEFANSVRAISAVSGGSVGAAEFLSAYTKNGIDPIAMKDVFRHASASSLDDVAWGLIYPDLLRLYAPFIAPGKLGRGWALEHAWSAENRALLTPLRSLRPLVASGRMPAAIFNTTVVETGERIVFSTYDTDPTGSVHQALTFQDRYPKLDVSMVTAARLSATFPYVTPAARPNTDLPKSKRLHFVDGGYWDNFGVASAVEFVYQAIERRADKKVAQVLLVEVRDRKSAAADSSQGSRGGIFQTLAPLDALLNVRDNGQVTRNAAEITLLRGYLKSKDVTLCSAVFESPQEAAPLSWHLRKSEIDAIDDTWKSIVDKNPEDLQKTLRFMTTKQCPAERQMSSTEEVQ